MVQAHLLAQIQSRDIPGQNSHIPTTAAFQQRHQTIPDQGF